MADSRNVPVIEKDSHQTHSNITGKNVFVRGYIAGTDTAPFITAVDNGDGTFSMKVSAALTGTVSVGNPVTVLGSVSITGVGGTVSIAAMPNQSLSGTVSVANFPATQPISAVSLPLPTGAATNAILTGGTQLSQIVDAGGDAVTVTGGKLDVNATFSGSSGGTSSVDDAGFTIATDSGTPMMGLADAVSPDSVNEGDVGVMRMSLARVQLGHIWDAAGNERGANVNASNQLSVSVDNTVTVGSHAVTNAGTFVVQENGAALTSLQLIDDVVYTDDTSTHATGTSKGVGIMAAATPTDTSVNANDMGMVAMTTDRRLLVDASGVAVPVTDNSGSLTVDYATTGSGNATGALRVELANNGTGVLSTLGTITNVVHVDDNSGSLTVDNGGTFAVQNTPVSPGTIFNGKTSTVTAGTRVVLAASQTVVSVTIKALITNTGLIYVGNSTVAASNGFQLSAGETVSFDLTNLNTINIDSSVSAEGVTYFAIGA